MMLPMRMVGADLPCVSSVSMILNGLLGELAEEMPIPTGLKSTGKSFSIRFVIPIKK